MAIERKLNYKSVLKMYFRLLLFLFDESQRVTEVSYLSSRFLTSVLMLTATQHELLIKSDYRFGPRKGKVFNFLTRAN